MKCLVYRSDRKSETFLYLAMTSKFEDLPVELQQAFGEPSFVMSLDLAPGRTLARVSAEKVRASLAETGYYLQLPPEVPVEEEISRRFSRD